MKKIMLKELRVGLKVALFGIGIFTLILTYAYKTYGSSVASLAAGQGFVSGEAMQPLLSQQFYLETACFCALFGIVLGWLQIRAEKHPDLWAFLIHRPMTRMAILRGKIAGGLILYALGAGLPLLGFIAFVRTPGHIAAPFEWPMTLPAFAIFLLGMVYYLAGMLTALRRARWYGSRGFGLGIAVFATMGWVAASEFWQALLILFATGSILALAVRGSFQAGGFYRGQTWPGKLALTLASVASTILILGVGVMALYDMLLAPESGGWSYTDYAMTQDGNIYKVTQHGLGKKEIVDLNGKPLLDENTGQPMKSKVFDERRALKSGAYARPGAWGGVAQAGYADHARFFIAWQLADQTLWYWSHDGRIVGYDGTTRLHDATFEAAGNSAGSSHAASGFIFGALSGYFNGYNLDRQRVLASSNTVYLVNFNNRTLAPIFTVSGGDSIGAYADPIGYTLQQAEVMTRKSIMLLNFDGRVEWSVPYQPSYPDYPQVSIIFLAATNRATAGKFAVEFQPDREANKKSGGKLPTRIEWITAGQGISKTLDLPTPPDPKNDNLREELAGLLMPVPISIAMAYSDDSDPLLGWMSVIPAVLCVFVGGWLGRRYSFSARAQVGWGVFNMLFGLPGLLAFLSVQEWPAREPCPHCKKLRVVDRAQCPHCGADFAPPEKNGTEIFETLTADLRA